MPIGGAEGVGRLRFSLLFKPLDIDLDPCSLGPLRESACLTNGMAGLRSWNVGCLEVDSVTVRGLREETQAKLEGAVDSLAKFSSTVQTSTQESKSLPIHSTRRG